MPSADSCAIMIGSPYDFPSSNNGTWRRPPQVSSIAFAAPPPDLQPWPLMELDFATSGSLVRPRMPHIRFLSVRSRLCSTLPSDAFARPCASLVLHLHQVGQGTFTPKLSNMLGTPLNRCRDIRCAEE